MTIQRDICVKCGKTILKDPEGRFRCWVHETVGPVTVSDQFCGGAYGLAKGESIFCLPAQGAVIINDEKPV